MFVLLHVVVAIILVLLLLFFLLLKQPLLLLPPHNIIPHKGRDKDAQRNGSAPPDDRVAQEVDLGRVIGPLVHTESYGQEGPLTGMRGEAVFLVGILSESVVEFHHGNIEVDKVFPEI